MVWIWYPWFVFIVIIIVIVIVISTAVFCVKSSIMKAVIKMVHLTPYTLSKEEEDASVIVLGSGIII